MLATSTHDTKRSEDVRTRISVLSEIPTEWRAAFSRWSALNSSKKVVVEGLPAPDANDEYLLYQTLVGAWPSGRLTPKQLAELRDRIVAYMQKATKEAKVHTSWVNPNDRYDAAVEQFVRGILSDDPRDTFMADIAEFIGTISTAGYVNSLSQQLIKLTAPGVPDLYQGTELWALSLVDPDNRRPVDFGVRRKLLDSIKEAVTEEGVDLAAYARSLLDRLGEGVPKLYVTHQTLTYRRDHPELFAGGEYLPLRTRGLRRRQVCSFARISDRAAALIVAPRLVVDMTNQGAQLPLGSEAWQDTSLIVPATVTATSWRNVFTGERVAVDQSGSARSIPLGATLESFPVALIVSETTSRRRRRG
jgi:(1->4)-alpha-D-glucan 1-alpha-D-glucosylmutase